MPEMLMPKLSDTMEEGTVLRWFKADGDQVAKGEPLVEIETDKATMTVEAPNDGTQAIIAPARTSPLTIWMRNMRNSSPPKPRYPKLRLSGRRTARSTAAPSTACRVAVSGVSNSCVPRTFSARGWRTPGLTRACSAVTRLPKSGASTLHTRPSPTAAARTTSPAQMTRTSGLRRRIRKPSRAASVGEKVRLTPPALPRFRWRPEPAARRG